MGTTNKIFSLGDRYVCIHRRLSEPKLGTIVALTTEPGKTIGLQFEGFDAGHNCDGFGEKNSCLWVTPDNIYSELEWSEIDKMQIGIRQFAAKNHSTLDINTLRQMERNVVGSIKGHDE